MSLWSLVFGFRVVGLKIQLQTLCTAYCIWSVISSFSNLNRRSSSLGLFCHVPLKRDQGDWHQRLWLKDTPNAIGCIITQHLISSISNKIFLWFDRSSLPSIHRLRSASGYHSAEASELQFNEWKRIILIGIFTMTKHIIHTMIIIILNHIVISSPLSIHRLLLQVLCHFTGFAGLVWGRSNMLAQHPHSEWFVYCRFLLAHRFPFIDFAAQADALGRGVGYDFVPCIIVAYVYIYMNKHKYTHVHIHVCICISIFVWINSRYTRRRNQMRFFLRPLLPIYIHIYIYTYIDVYINVYVYIYIHIYQYIYTYIFIHVHIHVCIRTYI